ncbi:MAG: hypothetical protein ABI175_13020 [Polyangiales bacterium]
MAEEIQRDVREAITTSDDLSRRAHDARLEPIAQRLDALRTALVRIDQAIGGSETKLRYVPRVAEVHRLVAELHGVSHLVAPEMRASFDELLTAASTLPDELGGFLASLGESRELPSEPLFDVLPLARVIPQDVHSITDYVHAAGCLATVFASDSVEAKVSGALLGASIGGVSLLTDYRLSAAKVIPVEVHEALDHGWGLAAIAAPFVLGYYKKDPAVAALHCLLGAGTILTSLFTDYRAARGVGR